MCLIDLSHLRCSHLNKHPPHSQGLLRHLTPKDTLTLRLVCSQWRATLIPQVPICLCAPIDPSVWVRHCRTNPLLQRATTLVLALDEVRLQQQNSTDATVSTHIGDTANTSSTDLTPTTPADTNNNTTAQLLSTAGPASLSSVKVQFRRVCDWMFGGHPADDSGTADGIQWLERVRCSNTFVDCDSLCCPSHASKDTPSHSPSTILTYSNLVLQSDQPLHSLILILPRSSPPRCPRPFVQYASCILT